MKERGAMVIWRCHVGVDEPKQRLRRAFESGDAGVDPDR